MRFRPYSISLCPSADKDNFLRLCSQTNTLEDKCVVFLDPSIDCEKSLRFWKKIEDFDPLQTATLAVFFVLETTEHGSLKSERD